NWQARRKVRLVKSLPPIFLAANDDDIEIGHRLLKSRQERLTHHFQAFLMGPDLHGFSYKIRNIAGADTLHHPGPMVFDSLRADAEPDPDLLARKACDRELHDLALPR